MGLVHEQEINRWIEVAVAVMQTLYWSVVGRVADLSLRDMVRSSVIQEGLGVELLSMSKAAILLGSSI